jgi:hypothetical protein
VVVTRPLPFSVCGGGYFIELWIASPDGLHVKKNTTLSNGYLGSRNDEERSEMRYVMRIAEFSESSNL